MPQFLVIRHRVVAATALAAPIASALAVASFHTHSHDPSRQLDLIKANVPGFTGMVLFENLTWICIVIACLAAASRVRGRGAVITTLGAAASIVGLVGSAGGFSGALPNLARQADRAGAVHFVNHLGPVYTINTALAAGTMLGLLLTFIGVCRNGAVAWFWLTGIVLGFAVLSLSDGKPLGMLAAFAVLAAPMSALSRWLWAPALPERQDFVAPTPAPADAHRFRDAAASIGPAV